MHHTLTLAATVQPASPGGQGGHMFQAGYRIWSPRGQLQDYLFLN
jgi:hypothetical protein